MPREQDVGIWVELTPNSILDLPCLETLVYGEATTFDLSEKRPICHQQHEALTPDEGARREDESEAQIVFSIW
jgi:hypothetical protein